MILSMFCSVITDYEQLRRLRAVTNTHRELPSVGMGKSADDFFHDLEVTTAEGSKLPNWFVPP